MAENILSEIFNQQFKRSCLPDGPKVGTVSLSPRGDWRMPSDASSAMWQKSVTSYNLFFLLTGRSEEFFFG